LFQPENGKEVEEYFVRRFIKNNDSAENIDIKTKNHEYEIHLPTEDPFTWYSMNKTTKMRRVMKRIDLTYWMIPDMRVRWFYQVFPADRNYLYRTDKHFNFNEYTIGDSNDIERFYE
jgi:hypothetical protein